MKKGLNPILGGLLLTLLGVFLYMVLGSLLGGVVAIFTGNRYGAYIISIIFILIYLIIYQNSNKKTFDGCFKSENVGTGFLLIVPWAIMTAIVTLTSMIFDNHLWGLTVDSVLLSLYAGICEEVTFRAVPVAHMMRYYNDEKDVIKVALLTSLFFSIVHATNLIVGADISYTVIQIAQAFSVGMLFCATYLRTGSILPAMICHVLNDTISQMDLGAYDANGVVSNVANVSARDWILNILATVIYLVVAIYALRPSKRSEIINIWSKKWKKDELTQVPYTCKGEAYEA